MPPSSTLIFRYLNSTPFILPQTKLGRKFLSSASTSRPSEAQYAEVRVRFAPSPTGSLHLGGLRTALYNYFMSRSCNGKFILRIEDTDQSRLVPGAVENVEDSLDWIGIPPDESPRYGGPFGPYVQSKRLALYNEYIERLLQTGAAYRCFCSPLRIELLRKNAIKLGEIPRYDNKCRSFDPKESQRKHTAGEPSVIRLRFDSKTRPFNDLVFGHILSNAENEGDFILIKSDGFPTYHFANVVDDHLMQISHVLRGIEWQVSTPKHLALYEAFSWTPPKFAHLPLLMNSDGAKLSKRQGATEILDYRKQGYLPEAIIGFLSQAGGGFRIKAAQSMTLLRKEELVQSFNIHLINRNSCRLDFTKLPEFNKQALVVQLQNSKQRKNILADVTKLVEEKFGLCPTEQQVAKVVDWISQQRLTTLMDLVSPDTEFLWRRPVPKKLSKEEHDSLREILVCFQQMQTEELKHDVVGKYMRDFCQAKGLHFKGAMKFLRTVLSGLDHGPGVGEMCEILGKKECLIRIENSVLCEIKSELKTE